MSLQSELSQFMGSDNYHLHWSRRLVFTDGVRHLAEQAGAYWLVDAIASYQGDRRITQDKDLRYMQFWTLRVRAGKGQLVCVADSGRPPAITQEIEFTDFPLDEVRVWVELGSIDGVNPVYVAMLPSER